MYEEIQYQFNAVSEKYDAQRQILIPCFKDFYGTALELSAQLPQVNSILDVGAGTGLMSAFFHEKYPDAAITLVDISEKMLAQAQNRFEGEDNIFFEQADFADADLGEASYDLVISGLAIHHLPHELKRLLFQKIFKALKPGGLFINADQVEGEDASADAYYKESWKKHVSNSSLEESDKKSAFQRIELDIFAKLSDQLQWLKDVGFTSVGNYYQQNNFVVFAASKNK